jgi:hypothetical protein
MLLRNLSLSLSPVFPTKTMFYDSHLNDTGIHVSVHTNDAINQPYENISDLYIDQNYSMQTSRGQNIDHEIINQAREVKANKNHTITTTKAYSHRSSNTIVFYHKPNHNKFNDLTNNFP